MKSTAPPRNAAVALETSPVGADENEWYRNVSSVQFILQLETGHTRHSHIDHQAARPVRIEKFEEFMGSDKRFRKKVNQAHQ